MKLSRTFAPLAIIFMIVLSGCGAIRSFTSSSSGTVSTLWTDVPPFPEAIKSDLPLPAAARLAIQTAASGKFDFIAYETPKLPPDVIAYYTLERMRAAGWTTSAAGCVGDKQSQDGGFCFFSKREGGNDITLAIVISRDTKDKPTSIYYARIDTGAVTK